MHTKSLLLLHKSYLSRQNYGYWLSRNSCVIIDFLFVRKKSLYGYDEGIREQTISLLTIRNHSYARSLIYVFLDEEVSLLPTTSITLPHILRRSQLPAESFR